MPLTVTTLPVKKCSGNDRSHFQNTNINIKISAENGRRFALAMLNRNLGDTTFMHEIIMGYQGEMSLKGLNLH